MGQRTFAFAARRYSLPGVDPSDSDDARFYPRFRD